MTSSEPRLVWVNYRNAQTGPPSLAPNTLELQELVNERITQETDVDSLGPSPCSHCGISIKIYCSNPNVTGLVNSSSFMKFYDGDEDAVLKGGFLAIGYTISAIAASGFQGGAVRTPRDLSAGCANDVLRRLKELMAWDDNANDDGFR